MKIFHLALASILLSASIHAHGQEVMLDSKVTEATIFLSGAQVVRQGSVRLTAGNNEVVVSGLTQQMDPNSVQIEGNTDYTILSVNHRMNHIQKTETPKEVEAAKDSLDAIDLRMRRISDRAGILEMEKQMITANKEVKGAVEGFDIDALIELANLYRNRLKTIEFELIAHSKRSNALKKYREKYVKQLKAWEAKKGQPTSEIVVKVSARQTKTCQFKVSYLVNKCGWTPAYDVRAEDVKGPVQLIYRGNVWQRTGEEWDKINITLSTGNPSLGGTQPEVSAWILEFYIEYAKKTKGVSNSYGNRVASAYSPAPHAPAQSDDMEEADISEVAVFEPMPESMANMTDVNASGVNNEFQIKLPYSVINNEEPISIEIQKINLPAKYQHVAIPKLDLDAFLTAKVTDWRAYSLLPGDASIYYQGTYVGQSYLDTRITNDTLNLSLGRDQGINIRRKQVNEFRRTTMTGSSKIQETGFEIEIRNNQKYTATMDLFDQIPVSTDKSAEVELLDQGNAEFNEDTGKLTWKLILGPGEQRSVRFKYSVKYPKDKIIPNL